MVVESVETVLSNLFNLLFHQHGQNRRNEKHIQWITCGVDYIHRFHNINSDIDVFVMVIGLSGVQFGL